MNPTNLPTVNAILTSISACLLLVGYLDIRKGNREHHRKWMIVALTTSILFLISCLIYHVEVGPVPYPHHD